MDWQITSLHGDLVAALHAGDEGLSRTSETTEYGTPRNSDDIGKQRYGWLGAKQRAADTPSGMLLMGVRLYNTATGRFLQIDPVYGGSANPYEYCGADPVNCSDLDGKRAECGCSSDYGWKRPVKRWLQRAIDGSRRAYSKFTRWQLGLGARTLYRANKYLFGRKSVHGYQGIFNRSKIIRLGWSWNSTNNATCSPFMAVATSRKNGGTAYRRTSTGIYSEVELDELFQVSRRVGRSCPNSSR
ncbi:RHS repeat-associated core domain-containing protein [Micromonospora rifamycinica]|uniref:RHS repeat-associated core domain-containing protein n=1 Tax=Micromonospora rifamycinica TaxID=291594 RepID=UPI0018D5130C|nr:RHS repeat-associated core domain-containing protein [Micromonospora rifamycinica]